MTSELKLLKKAGKQASQRLPPGRASKNRLILSMWLLFDIIILGAQKERGMLHWGGGGVCTQVNIHSPLTREQFNTLEIEAVFQVLYTVVQIVFPDHSIFATGLFQFEDTFGDTDSIHLANNIHFVFISWLRSFPFQCLI